MKYPYTFICIKNIIGSRLCSIRSNRVEQRLIPLSIFALITVMEDTSSDNNTRYTIVLDIFKPIDLFQKARSEQEEKAKATHISTEYLRIIQKKHLLKYPEDLVLDSWCSQVYEKEDIFIKLPRDRTKRQNSNKDLLDFTQVSTAIEKETALTGKETAFFADYRFSRVDIIGADMKKGEIISSNEPLKAKLLGYGVVRLYKDRESKKGILMKNKGDDTTVAILGVPFYFTTSDLLLGFFDKEVLGSVSHMRLLKTQTPNRYMVLMKFRNALKAKEFLEKYNGRHFNSMEPEACQIIFIKEILFRPLTHSMGKLSTIPYLLDDPFTSTKAAELVPSKDGKRSSRRESSSSHEKDKKDKTDSEAGQGSSEYTELATCPVCLERLDATVTGLLTIPCQHTFHSSCLAKWTDDTCPVCRYSSRLDMRKSQEESRNDKCTECNATDNLWICLLCGHIGCGRYDSGHAIDHYNKTLHCFAMEIATQRVWDYAGDNYVHRLVQSEVDGKYLELPIRDKPRKSFLDDDDDDYEDDEDEGGDDDEKKKAKIEKIGLEYSNMLISQLESQREFYDSKFAEVQNKFSLANQNLTAVKKTLSVLKQKLEKVSEEYRLCRKTNPKELSDVKRKYEGEKSLNKAFMEKLSFLTSENSKLQDKNKELEEQVRDLMFYLDTQDKLKDAPEDVKDGQIVIKKKPKKHRKSKK